jgi:Zn-dependent peptidase ImmA (M78 family)
MNPRKKAAFEQKATELWKRVGAGGPPVAVDQIARAIGAEIRYEPADEEVSGMAWRSTDSAIIGVNSLHAKTRRRFTIAHEIAHLVLHADYSFHVHEGYALVGRRDGDASRGVYLKEVEANYFAAALLMPKDLLLKDAQVRTLRFDFEREDAIKSLARRYDVSQQALTIRLWEVFGISLSAVGV